MPMYRVFLVASLVLAAACDGCDADPTNPIDAALSIVVTGNGRVDVAPSNLSCTGECTTTFEPDTEVTLTAVSATDVAFNGWGGDCAGVTETHCTLTLVDDARVTASFRDDAPVRPQLTVTVVGNGTVTSEPPAISCPGLCGAAFDSGAEVTLTATPQSGQSFTGWSGACTGTAGCVLTLDDHTAVTATFAPITHTLLVEIAGVGEGVVTSLPDGIDCPGSCTLVVEEGDSVTLTAQPAPGSYFSGWADACSGTGACVVTPTGETTVTADFNPLGVPPPPPSPGWPKRVGNIDFDIGRDVAIDPSGNVIVVGHFFGLVDFGGGPLESNAGTRDIFLVKYTAAGDHVWSKRYGGEEGADDGLSIAADKDGNVLVSGIFSGTTDFGDGDVTSAGAGDIFLLKLLPNGDLDWKKTWGSTWAGESGVATDVDALGNVVITGGFGGTVDFGDGPVTQSGGFDMFLVKLAPDGSHVWSQVFSGSGSSGDGGTGVGFDPDGDVLFTGYYKGEIDVDGTVHTNPNGNGADIVVGKLDGDTGARVWSSVLEVDDWGVPRGGLAVDGSGDLFIVGEFRNSLTLGAETITSQTPGAFDIFVFKLSGVDGAPLWDRTFASGSSSHLSAYDAEVDPSGNVVVVGDFYGETDFGAGNVLTGLGLRDAWAAKLSAATGATVYAIRYGSAGTGETSGDDFAQGVAVDGNNTIAITGAFEGTVDFDGTSLTSAGVTDVFVVRLSE